VAYLHVIRGPNAGQVFSVDEDPTLLGRHPTCHVVLDDPSISRYHAQVIVRPDGFFVEDLRSRNGTKVNGELIEQASRLADGDELVLCENALVFQVGEPTATDNRGTQPTDGLGAPTTGIAKSKTDEYDAASPSPVKSGPDRGGDPPLKEESEILRTVQVGNRRKWRLDVRPEAKLRAVLEVSQALGRHLELEETLDQILQALFRVYPQADEGFVLTQSRNDPVLRVRSSMTRNGKPSESRPSMTVVTQAVSNREAILSSNTTRDARFELSESLASLAIRSTVCIPLVGSEGRVLGAIQINSHDLTAPFKEDDLDVLLAISSQVVLALEYTALYEEVLIQRDVQRDLEFATQVQRGFLPNRRPEVSGYSFHDYYLPARNVGGDYFDYVSLEQGRIGIALADVAGKGVPAALLMARLYSAARSHLLSKPTAAKALTALNAEITESNLGHRFITCVLGILDPQANTLTLANAGHLTPLIRRGTAIDDLPRNVSGLPIGISPQITYSELELPLNPGDACLLYTDGVTEAMDPDKELFGVERLSTEFIRTCEGTAEDPLAQILTAIDEFSRESPRERDDVCMMMVRRTP